jgi:hypothetical protein
MLYANRVSNNIVRVIDSDPESGMPPVKNLAWCPLAPSGELVGEPQAATRRGSGNEFVFSCAPGLVALIPSIDGYSPVSNRGYQIEVGSNDVTLLVGRLRGVDVSLYDGTARICPFVEWWSKAKVVDNKGEILHSSISFVGSASCRITFIGNRDATCTFAPLPGYHTLLPARINTSLEGISSLNVALERQ